MRLSPRHALAGLAVWTLIGHAAPGAQAAQNAPTIVAPAAAADTDMARAAPAYTAAHLQHAEELLDAMNLNDLMAFAMQAAIAEQRRIDPEMADALERLFKPYVTRDYLVPEMREFVARNVEENSCIELAAFFNSHLGKEVFARVIESKRTGVQRPLEPTPEEREQLVKLVQSKAWSDFGRLQAGLGQEFERIGAKIIPEVTAQYNREHGK